MKRLATPAIAASLLIIAACGSSQKTDTGNNSNTMNALTPQSLAAISDIEVFQDDADAFAPKCRSGLEDAKKALALLLSVEGQRNKENTLDVLNYMFMHLERSDGTAGLLAEVHPDAKLREAARECAKEVSSFSSSLGRNVKLYEAIKAVDTSVLDAEGKRLVERDLRDFRRSGVDKSEEVRTQLADIDKQLVELGQQFSKRNAEDVRTIVMPKDALNGLPDDYIAAHAPNDKGEVSVTTQYPDYVPFISYSESTEWRKKAYIQFRSRGGQDNEDLLKQIFTLRKQKADLLGYKTWADYATEDKMMKSGDRAAAFIERIAGVAKTRAERDYQELLAYKKKSLDKKASVVQDYEKEFIKNKVKAENYAFDSQSVRPYFPYAQVEQGVLDITAKIYGIEYKRLPEAPVWHEEVKAFDVFREGENIGRIYLDMHPRDGKYGHAAQFPYRSGVKGVQLPAGVLVCNFPKPSDKDPGLMEHGDVVTMFHEFGHLMHHTLGGQKSWIAQSGVATEWDFVEAPSQMFEEWAWSHNTLKTFAKHHESGAEIPKELVDKMRKADKFGIGLQTVQQMFYASISLNFHTIDPSELNMMEEMKKLQAKYTPFPYVEGTRFYSSFGHLNGYSAIYYTYMWSLVIAKDLLTPFKEAGLLNTEWTYKYRDVVLAQGGSEDAADLVEEFLGREFSFDAFEEYVSGN